MMSEILYKEIASIRLAYVCFCIAAVFASCSENEGGNPSAVESVQ